TGRSHGAGRRTVAEAPEEAAALAGVAGPASFLLHDEQQRVDVAVVARFPEGLAGAPPLPPSPPSPPGAGPPPTRPPAARPRAVERVLRRAASFIHANISTSPVPASWTMAPTRPSAL